MSWEVGFFPYYIRIFSSCYGKLVCLYSYFDFPESLIIIKVGLQISSLKRNGN